MEERLRRIPIGVDDFSKLRKGGYYFVDKSELISDIASKGYEGSEVYLFTRPRRFGKSLNLSMIDCFFNLEYKGNTWFDGLKVMGHQDASAVMNRYPVIHLDMKDLPVSSFEGFLRKLAVRISELFLRYSYLKDSSALEPEQMDFYMRGRAKRLSEEELQDSLRSFCSILAVHHGIEPVVLIDEYDNAINNAYGHESYGSILEFLQLFYSGALKGDQHLSFAVVTGVMQIARGSIFSGLNKLRVNNIFAKVSDERYGFTAEEVKDLCIYYGHPERFEKAREWYDGYRFGDADIYNPWSVLNYIDSGFEPQAYWAGTSGNDIIDTLILNADDETYGDLLALGEGRVLEGKDITPTITMEDLGKKKDAVYSVMVMSGYLKVVPSLGGYDLSIPNMEMYEVFADVIAVREGRPCGSNVREAVRPRRRRSEPASRGYIGRCLF